MRLRLRLLWILIISLWRKPITPLEESVLSFRALPNDIDVSKITDDRYVSLTDLGRLDMSLRSGVMKVLARRKLIPVATFATVRFRHPLSIFQKYNLRSRLVFWDAGAFYFQHIFERHGRYVATAYVRVALVGPNGIASPIDVLAEAKQASPPPNASDIVLMMCELDEMVHQEQKESSAPQLHEG